MYSAVPNGLILYTKKSQIFKNNWNLFLSFEIHDYWYKIIAGK